MPMNMNRIENALRRDATDDDLREWGARFNPETGQMDGLPKQAGWRGVLSDGRGGVMTEVSVGANIDGREMEIPLIVPDSTEDDLQRIAGIARGETKEVPADLVAKAAAFARRRIAEGKSAFYDGAEEDEALRRVTEEGGWRFSNETPLIFRYGNDSETMRRALLEDPLAMVATKDRPAFARYMKLAGMDEQQMREAAMKQVASRWFANQYNLPFEQVKEGFGALTRNVFGKDMSVQDVYMALREMKQREYDASFGRRMERTGRNLYAGLAEAEKGLSDTARVVAVEGLSGLNRLANTLVYTPLAHLAEKQGYADLGQTLRGSIEADPLASVRGWLRDHSRAMRQLSEYQQQAGGDTGGFGEDIWLGVIRNLPNILLVVGMAEIKAGTYASGALGAITGASEYADTENMSYEKRLLNALAVGGAEAFFENWTGAGAIVRRFWNRPLPAGEIRKLSTGFGATLMRTARDLGLSAVGEGWEEVETGIVQRFSNLLFGKDGKTLAGMSLMELAHALLDDAPMEFAVGAVSGGLMGSMGAHARYKANKWNAAQLNARADILGAARADLAKLEKAKNPTPEQVKQIEFLRGAIAEQNSDAIIDNVIREFQQRQKADADDDLTTDEWAKKQAAEGIDELKQMAADGKQGAAKSALSRLVDEAVRELNLGDLAPVLVNTPEELPEPLYRKYLADGRPAVDGVYNPGDGRVYLVARNLSAGTIKKVILHEAVGHKGLRELFGDNYNAFLNEIADTFPEEIAAVAQRRKFDLTNPARRLEAIDEFLAERSEAGIDDAGTWKKIVGRFRAFLRRIGWDLGWTDDDLAYLLRQSASHLRRGRQAAQGGDGRFSVVGEQGARSMAEAETLAGNLETARIMQSFGKDARTIKLATGWELGGDGLWRMELPDARIKREFAHIPDALLQTAIGPLADYVDAPELFEAYPQLKDTTFTITSMPIGTSGSYEWKTDTIRINRSELMRSEEWRAIEKAWSQRASAEERGDTKEIARMDEYIETMTESLLYRIDHTLIHEIQHAIQHIEGFAEGGSPESAAPLVRNRPLIAVPRYRKLIDDAEAVFELNDGRVILSAFQEEDFADEKQGAASEMREWLSSRDGEAQKRGYESAADLYRKLKDMYDGETPYGKYRRLAGEVEARNVQTREDMTMEERRQSLLDDTADVAPEDRIYIRDLARDSAMAEEAGFATGDPDIDQAYPVRSARNQQEALAALKRLAGKNIINRETGLPAQINRTQRDKLVSSASREKSNANGFSNEDHFHAVSNIDRLYENATMVDDRQDRDNNADVLSIKRFVAPVYLNGEFAEAYITVKETVGSKIYSLELDELKKPSDTQGSTLPKDRYYIPEGWL